MAPTDNDKDREIVVTRYRIKGERIQGTAEEDPLLERCLDIVEGTMRSGMTQEVIRNVVHKIGATKTEWHAQRHIRGNQRFFAALRTAAMFRGISARANNLYHDSRYIALCRAREKALTYLNLKSLGAEKRVFLTAHLVRMTRELAGILFVLPELLPTSYLGLLSPKRTRPADRKRKYSGPIPCEHELVRRRREVAATLLWNEPVPILIDKRNEDAVQWHLEPENPDDSGHREKSHGFLWGRRILVSLPINEVLGGSISSESLWAAIQDMARKADADRLGSHKHWRGLKKLSLRIDRQRLEVIVRSGGSQAIWARILGEAYDETLRHIDDYYGGKAGKRRGKRDRGGIADMIRRINAVEEAFETRNWELKKSPREDIEDRIASNPAYDHDGSSEETLTEIVDWLRQALPNYGLQRKVADKVVKDMLQHRLNDGRLSEGRSPARPKGLPGD